MTVIELIEALKHFREDARVVIAYDNAVCHADISLVELWRPNAYSHDDPSDAEVVVGLFERSSADDLSRDAEDARTVPT